MPDRIIRSAILASDRVNRLSWPAEVFYRRLMSVADDFGLYDGRAPILRAMLFPLKLDRVTESDIGKWIRECGEAGLVRVDSVDSRDYVEIKNFNQRTRATDSKWPRPPSSADKCPQLPALVSIPPSSADNGGHPRTYSYSDSKSYSKEPAPKAPLAVEIPASLQTPDFVAAWTEWRSHRAEIKHPLKPTQERAALEAMSKIGAARAVVAVRFTIIKGWKGLREPDPADAKQFQQTRTGAPQSSMREPDGWKAWLNHAHPNHHRAANGGNEAHDWNELEPSERYWIINEMRREDAS